ncbi:MAG: NAD-dependent epimerase [Ignavibacteriales bacterium]|nr:NAD-dependent epimerase [Ignavibacteriales bacterium]MCF8315089.1 NAD-dependent epimerase [Ignavibacteriales bacterium]MCF8435915.1 NAD-dependent epimerase [Ignavibacteriales bacterium]
MKKILITGAAGFIGFHLLNRLISEGYEIIGMDNLNDYYDPALKFDRLTECGISKSELTANRICKSTLYQNYRFIRLDLLDISSLLSLFEEEKFDYVLHLAAQPGVRYSLVNPQAYIDSNITGFLNILESCRKYPVKHLIFASSSSIYGVNTKMPFSVRDNVDHPVSLYAATKKSNELMAHTYSHLFNIPSTGLRFFTVYGPWGRPDMAYFKFTKAILGNNPIEVFNYGNMKRDFTYIGDIVESISRLLPKAPQPDKSFDHYNNDSSRSWAAYRVLNIGNHNPVQLKDFIHELEKNLGKKAEINYLPMQPGDVEATYADVEELNNLIDYAPRIGINEGIREFIDWYIRYYKISS